MTFSSDTKQKIISNMCDMIKCATVSHQEDSLVDWSQFEKFENLLKEKYPTIYKQADFFKIGRTGLVHKIKAPSPENKTATHNAAAANSAHVLMAHYDVVPALQAEWDFPAFAGDLVSTNEGDFIRGRGTLDTKGTLCAIMEAVEIKLKEGWLPKTDLYLCFSGEEEISGNTTADIVDWFKNQNINVEFVLDEGGAIVENAFPGISKRCAMVGTAEKGFINMDITIEGKAGHASAPPKHSSIGLAAKVATAIEKSARNSSFGKTRFTKPVKELFNVMGPNNKNAALKFLFTNLWLTKPLVNLASKIIGGELYALLHTTTALTMMEGSKAYNVLPSQGKIGLNFRLLEGDTVEKAKNRVEKLVKKVLGKNAKFSINVAQGNNPSIVSSTNCPQWENLYKVIHKTWPEILISPYLMMACSDSRHYCKITDKVYRFSGMFLSKEERGMIHGKNERISTETLLTTVEFYINLLEVMYDN